jgi:hypothetical protein
VEGLRCINEEAAMFYCVLLSSAPYLWMAGVECEYRVC